jgi:hypothetical protein
MAPSDHVFHMAFVALFPIGARADGHEMCALPCDEDGAVGVVDNLVRHAADKQRGKFGQAAGSHDDQVSVEFVRR